MLQVKISDETLLGASAMVATEGIYEHPGVQSTPRCRGNWNNKRPTVSAKQRASISLQQQHAPIVHISKDNCISTARDSSKRDDDHH